MNLSIRTKVELAHALDNLTQAEIDRIFQVFTLSSYLYPERNLSVKKKVNTLLEFMQASNVSAPFGTSFSGDLLQYFVDNFYRRKNLSNDLFLVDRIPIEDKFNREFSLLANALKRDGYFVKHTEIKKLLPEEIEEAKTESELLRLLTHFGFTRTKSHLEQAILSHTDSQWASANSQFRTTIESLLMEICNKLLPNNVCSNAAGAINLLSNTLSPSFLKSELNEVAGSRSDNPFVDALFKRLHPEGSHPGLSDEDDSTFRYHLVVIFANYVLRRLETR